MQNGRQHDFVSLQDNEAAHEKPNNVQKQHTCRNDSQYQHPVDRTCTSPQHTRAEISENSRRHSFEFEIATTPTPSNTSLHTENATAAHAVLQQEHHPLSILRGVLTWVLLLLILAALLTLIMLPTYAFVICALYAFVGVLFVSLLLFLQHIVLSEQRVLHPFVYAVVDAFAQEYAHVKDDWKHARQLFMIEQQHEQECDQDQTHNASSQHQAARPNEPLKFKSKLGRFVFKPLTLLSRRRRRRKQEQTQSASGDHYEPPITTTANDGAAVFV
jgi:hypothetical protein